MLKPSEGSPHTAVVMQKIMAAALDPDYYACVQGGVPETTALLNEKWDKIFYTGSARVGTIIAKKAAETLTPVTLELGGRNPAIVTRRADVHLAARRLLWAKVMNAGQVCVSQNYILADAEIVDTLVAELKAALAEFFPGGVRDDPDYGRIVNTAQFDRIKKMLDATAGRIVAGGTMDRGDLYIEPTVVVVDSARDSLIVDESFGPLIPILPVADLTEAIRTANAVHATPLGVYAFGHSDETARILRETRSGGATVNDGFVHASIPTLAFGGVGESGSGAYRGRASFDCFTHRRSVASTPGWLERLLALRYPPYHGTNKLRRLEGQSRLTPDFDRDGRRISTVASLLVRWARAAVGIGGGRGLRSGALRAALVLAGVMMLYRTFVARPW